MGSLQAQEMAERLPLRQALKWHLQSNHYPPVPLSMVNACIKAIQSVNVEEYYTLIKLPKGITFRGLTEAPANEIVKAYHLDAWLDLIE